MAVHFIDTETGEISEAPVARKDMRKAPKAEKAPRPKIEKAGITPIGIILWSGAVALGVFLGFCTGALGNSLYVQELTGQIAVLETRLEVAP